MLYCVFCCACAKRPYFHFRSKIWRYRRVPRPRFLVRRRNFGDSRTFNAVMGLLFICACLLRTSSCKMGGWGKMSGCGWCDVRNELELAFAFGGFMYVPILVKMHQEMRKSARRRTHGQRQTGVMIYPMLCAMAIGQIKKWHIFGRLLLVDLIKWISNARPPVRTSVHSSVRPSVHKKFLRFQRNLVCR